MQGHALVGERFAQAVSQIVETSSPQGEAAVRARLARPWWSPARWSAAAPRFGLPQDGSQQMLWSNMALHMAAEPQALIARVPLANVIYTSARKLLDMLETKPGSTQRVVLIDFPHRDMKSVGLVTRVIREEGSGRELAAVYVPTTPNPTSGYLEIVPVELLTPTDWTVDQAMSFIISGGAVAPDAMPFTRAGER